MDLWKKAVYSSSAPNSGNSLNIHNYIRAETDTQFRNWADLGAFAKFYHFRNVVPLDQQVVIRMNRDTLISGVVLDLNSPATIKLPDGAGRYLAMQVINQDHYTKLVANGPGSYILTRESMGTRYVGVIVRILVDADSPDDVRYVNSLQDQIELSQEAPGVLDIPDWDMLSLKKLRDALLILSSASTSLDRTFGDVGEVDPIDHLLGTAYGWGGQPISDAVYLNMTPEKNDGSTPHTLLLKDIPVNAFWSISLYNAQGFFEQNDLNAYVINDRNATMNDDGSVTIHFGGSLGQPNYLPFMAGWNYIMRLYKPTKEFFDGTWKLTPAMPGNLEY